MEEDLRPVVANDAREGDAPTRPLPAYERPAIIYEGTLETRAGSPMIIPFDMTHPGIPPTP